MRALACVLAISLAATPATASAPSRVASLKLCTDELLLLLAKPEQIASVTYLSQEPLETPLWREARRHRKNDGSLISVAGLAPDLVIDMGGGGRDGELIARRLGIPTLMLPYPLTLEDIIASVRKLAAALHRKAAGERAIARIMALRRSAPRTKTDTIWLGGGGRSLAPDSLAAQWLALAGLRQRPLRGDRATLEQLITRPPEVLVLSNYRNGQYSSEQRWLAHPLIAGTARSRRLATDGRRWTCMGPLMVDEIVKLRTRAGN